MESDSGIYATVIRVTASARQRNVLNRAFSANAGATWFSAVALEGKKPPKRFMAERNSLPDIPAAFCFWIKRRLCE